MKLKITSLIGLLAFSINFSYASVQMVDVNVMQKDTQQAASSMAYYANMVSDLKTSSQNVAAQTSTVTKLQALVNSSSSISEICTGCSDTTLASLQDWQAQNAQNICQELNNQLSLVSGQMTSMSQMQTLVKNLTAMMSTGKADPSALTAAFSQATTQTLTQMNQTQQQLANYTLQEKQADKVEAKIKQMKMNKTMFGASVVN